MTRVTAIYVVCGYNNQTYGLLVYSHVTRGVSSVEMVDLNQMFSFVLDGLEQHIEEKGASVEISPLPTIQGRPRQLQQLFENLIASD